MLIRVAEPLELPLIAALMNRAYRSGGDAAGWTTEAHLLAGDRTNLPQLQAQAAASPDGAFLVGEAANDQILTSVWVEPKAGPGAVWSLGGLAVEPSAQASGLGRATLTAAEAWVTDRGARAVRITVVNQRDTLIAWYGRRGYRRTGEEEAYPYGDDRFGVPLRDDLAFVVMEKPLR